MGEIVTVHVAKTHLSKLLARVEAGETITIARGKVLVAKLVPAVAKETRIRRDARKIQRRARVFDPLPADELDRWER